MSRRVFVLEEVQKYDISTARRYGHIEYVFERNELRPAMWSNAFIEEILNRLVKRGFDCRLEYLLMVGSFVPNVLFAVHATRKFGELNMLLFDAVSNEYVLHKVL